MVCSACYRRGWGTKCHSCFDDFAPYDQGIFGGYCKSCFREWTDEGNVAVMAEEAEAYSHGLDQKIDLRGPAVDNILLLPIYADP